MSLGSSEEVPAPLPQDCAACKEVQYTRPKHCDSEQCPWWTCRDCGFTNNGKGVAKKFAKGD